MHYISGRREYIVKLMLSVVELDSKYKGDHERRDMLKVYQDKRVGPTLCNGTS